MEHGAKSQDQIVDHQMFPLKCTCTFHKMPLKPSFLFEFISDFELCIIPRFRDDKFKLKFVVPTSKSGRVDVFAWEKNKWAAVKLPSLGGTVLARQATEVKPSK